MAQRQFIAYYRVSMAEGNRFGLGLEAQKAAVLSYLNDGGSLVAEFTEIDSGKRVDRPELVRALAACRVTGATLVIAKLNRLTRSLAFLANLKESGVDFVACDNPHATKFTVHVLAAMAEHEREAIAKRTKEALAAAKARGKRLGGYRGGPPPNGQLGGARRRAKADAFATRVAAPTLAEMRQRGVSLHQMAAEVSARSIPAPGGGAWTATAVRRVLVRVAACQPTVNGHSLASQPLHAPASARPCAPCSIIRRRDRPEPGGRTEPAGHRDPDHPAVPVLRPVGSPQVVNGLT
jgi:DNA invertase Pin-like site-specific DNA recombinase